MIPRSEIEKIRDVIIDRTEWDNPDRAEAFSEVVESLNEILSRYPAEEKKEAKPKAFDMCRIQRIKKHRERYGSSLKDAKDAIDRYDRRKQP